MTLWKNSVICLIMYLLLNGCLVAPDSDDSNDASGDSSSTSGDSTSSTSGDSSSTSTSYSSTSSSSSSTSGFDFSSWSGSWSGSWSHSSSSWSHSSSSWGDSSSTQNRDSYSAPSMIESISSFGTGDDTQANDLRVTETAIDPDLNIPQRLLQPIPRNHTTSFVTSSVLEPFYMANGTAIAPTQARESATKKNMCQCKMACWSALWCVAVSGKKNMEEQYDCYFSDHLPKEPGATVSDADSIYILFKDRVNEPSIEKQNYQIKDKKQMYMLVTTPLNFPKAEAFCHSFPGFRLGIFVNKEEWDILFSIVEIIGDGIFMGLRKLSFTEFLWDDGTPAGESYHQLAQKGSMSGNSDDEPYMRIVLRQGNYNFYDTAGTFKAICQAYLF